MVGAHSNICLATKDKEVLGIALPHQQQGLIRRTPSLHQVAELGKIAHGPAVDLQNNAARFKSASCRG